MTGSIVDPSRGGEHEKPNKPFGRAGGLSFRDLAPEPDAGRRVSKKTGGGGLSGGAVAGGGRPGRVLLVPHTGGLRHRPERHQPQQRRGPPLAPRGQYTPP